MFVEGGGEGVIVVLITFSISVRASPAKDDMCICSGAFNLHTIMIISNRVLVFFFSSSSVYFLEAHLHSRIQTTQRLAVSSISPLLLDPF